MTNDSNLNKQLCESNYAEEIDIVIKDENVKHMKAYGLYVIINAEFDLMIDALMLSDAETKIPICINYHGREKNFTMLEFIERLGLAESEYDDK